MLLPNDAPASRAILASRPVWTRRRKIALAILATVTVLVCCGLLWEPVTCGVSLGCPSEVTLDEVAGRAELTFPPGTELAGGEAEYWIDWYLQAEVRFPAGELDGFVKSNGLPAPLPGKLTDGLGGDEPEGTALATITETCTEFACREMILVLDDPQVVEVHLYVVENPYGAGEAPTPSPTG